MIISDFRERYLFIAFTSLLIILVLILSKLSAPVGAKTVQVATVGECHRVSFATGNRHDFLVAESLDARWIGLVRLVLGVLGKVTDVVQAQLSQGGLTPCVNVPFLCEGHRVRVTAGELCDDQSVQTFDLFWYRHEGASIDVKRHLEDVSKA